MVNKLHAAHILVKTEQEALGALFDIKHGKDFGVVAKEKSMCPSAKNGGDLGWFGRNIKKMRVKNTKCTHFLDPEKPD